MNPATNQTNPAKPQTDSDSSKTSPVRRTPRQRAAFHHMEAAKADKVVEDLVEEKRDKALYVIGETMLVAPQAMRDGVLSLITKPADRLLVEKLFADCLDDLVE